MKLVSRKEPLPKMTGFTKMCEKLVLEKTKAYRSDFYEYDVKRINEMTKDDRAVFMVREWGTYLAMEKEITRSAWEFYNDCFDQWPDSEFYLLYRRDYGKPVKLNGVESARCKVTEFYSKNVYMAVGAYDNARAKYDMDIMKLPNVEMPDIKDFGITAPEYVLCKKRYMSILTDRKYKTEELGELL